MEVGSSNHNHTKPKKGSSFLDRIKMVTMRQKSYSSFHTNCDSVSYQGKAEKNDMLSNWRNDWIKGNKSDNTMEATTVDEVEAEQMLRVENERLKARLNAAENAIRDMENVRKNQNRHKEKSSVSPFCSFLPKKLRNRQTSDGSNDATISSQALTVQMGSSSIKDKSQKTTRKQSKKNRKDSRKQNGSEKPSRSRLSRKLGRKQRQEEQRGASITPPCSPERLSQNAPVSDSDSETSPVPVPDILKDISSSILGIGTVKPTSLPKEQRKKKLQLFSRLSSKHSDASHQDEDHGHDDGRFSFGDYPIDIFPATPILDESSDDEAYPLYVISEEERDDRAEI